MNDAGSVAFLHGLGAAVRLNGGPTETPGTTPTTPFVRDLTLGTGPVARWGADNLEPQRILEDIRQNTIAAPTLEWKSRALYGGGLMYGSFVYGDNGEETFKPTRIPEIEAFSRRNQLHRFAMATALDVVTFYNAFPELILSKDRSEITNITRQKVPYCRWARQNEQTGFVENCFINANWHNWTSESDIYAVKVPAIIPGYDLTESLRNDRRGYKYIYPLSYPSHGETYYQLASWNVLRTSGWLEVAQAIPAFKKALFKNQITIKYLIEVSTWWWKWKYGEAWETKPLEERKKLMNDELAKFESFMTGTGASGSSLMVTFHSDPVTQKEYAGWKITPIDNKIKDGIYVEDSQEASLHIYSALDVDPTLRGISPGKSMGGGSGSDKRVAFNVYLSLQQSFQDIVTEVLQFICDYNKWTAADGMPIVWRFRNALITTLDTGSEMKKPTQAPPQQ
ncbi:hypothetical protein AXW84_06080 [Hymenobacter sp. PAMC 26628]|nr:hypothetical protein AXW84_06080 [Hymenobacter sp. PAMC 26628]